MASDTYTLEVVANIDKYVERVSKIPGITEKQVAQATLKFQSQLLKAANAARKTESASGGFFAALGEGADKAGERAAKLRGALDTLSPSAGAAAGLVNDLGDALSVLASPVGIAVAGVGALALGAAGMGAAIISSTFAADDALKSLEGFKKIGSDFYPAIPQSTIDSIERANASTAALGSIWDRAVVTLGSAVAPTVERVTSTLVGAALAAGDLWDSVAGGFDVLEVFGRTAIAWMVQPLAMVTSTMSGTADGFLRLADVAGVQLPASVRDSAASLRDLASRLQLASSGLVDQAIEGTKLGGVLTGLEDRGRKFVTTQIHATAAMKAEKKEVYDLVGGLSKLSSFASDADAGRLTGAAKIRAATQDQIDKLDDAYAAEAKSLVERKGSMEELDRLTAAYGASKVAITAEGERQIQELQDETKKKFISGMDEADRVYRTKMAKRDAAAKALSESIAAANQRDQDAIISAADQSLGALASLAGTAAEKTAQTNAAVSKRWFAFQQGAAVSQALINGALAVTKSLAELGPIAGGIAAVGVGITTGVQVAQILSQEPPSYHVGGVISAVPDLAPDERMAVVRPGEGFLTARGVREAGGPAGVAAMNQGRPKGGGSTSVSVELRVTGKTAQRIVEVADSQPKRGGNPSAGQKVRVKSR